MHRFFKVIAAIALLAVAALLLFGFLNHFSALADSLSHFRLHFIVLAVLLSFGFLALRAWRWGAAAMAVIVIGLFGLQPAFPYFPVTPVALPQIRMIQFNTLFNNPKPDFSAQWLVAQAPDITTLQEVSKNNQVIIDELSKQMPSKAECKFTAIGRVVVLSKYPKLAEKCVEGSGLVWMQVMIDGKPVTIASVHLHWPYPFRQQKQLDYMRTELEAMPRPVILAGDFNAAPWSEAVAQVGRASSTIPLPGLRMTLRMGFYGIGPFPVLPIDQVLAPDGTSPTKMEVGPPIGSDHLPVVVQFGLP